MGESGERKEEASQSEVRKAGESMAEKEGRDREMAGKGDGSKENVVKGIGTRGRVKKASSEAAEAAAMKKFLEAKTETAVFKKSEKVIYSPEKEARGIVRSRDALADKEDSDGNNTVTDKEEDGSMTTAVAVERAARKTEGERGMKAAEADEMDGAKKTNTEVIAEEVGNAKMVRLLCDKVTALDAIIGKIRKENVRIDRELVQVKELRKSDRLENEEQKNELTSLRKVIERLEGEVEEGRERIARLSKEVEECARQKGAGRGEGLLVENRRREGGSENGSAEMDENEAGEEDRMSESEWRRVSPRNGAESMMMQKEYLKNMPDALGEGEYIYEIAERKNRRRNIFVKGTRTTGAGIKEELVEFLGEKTGVKIYVNKVRIIGGGLVVEMESMANKLDLMKNKKFLRGTDIRIEDDLTNREKEVQEWLKSIEKEERKNGLEVRVGYLKIRVDGIQYRWVEKRGRLEEQESETVMSTFRK